MPNQTKNKYESLTSRCLTDLSVDINEAMTKGNYPENMSQPPEARHYTSIELASFEPAPNVSSVQLWYPKVSSNDVNPILIIVLEDAHVMLYQSYSSFNQLQQERFRFKLIDSHILIRPTLPSMLHEPI